PLRDRKTADDRDERHQPFVFPRSVEVMEGVQEFIPSAIRLEHFDREAVGLAQPIFAFCAVDPARRIIKSVDGSEYGKMSVSVGYYAFATGERRRKEIERAADGVDDDARLCIEAKISGSGPADYKKILSGIWIRLYDDCVWAAPLPGFESLLHDW